MSDTAVTIEIIDPAHHHAQSCLAAYYEELNRRFDAGFDPERSRTVGLDEVTPPNGVFLVAYLDTEPIGCGALKFHGTDAAEIKRMWVADSARGLGIGRRLLRELEGRAETHGNRGVRLDTNGTLIEAIAMYRAHGYIEIDAFNDEPYANLWFEKTFSRDRRDP